MKIPRSSVAVSRGRLTSSVTPSAVPTRIMGTSRTHSSRSAFLGFSKPMRSAQARSARTNSASANLSGTRCVASGMVTSAAPKPVMPKISAPMNAIPASSATSCTDYQIAWRAAVHRAQARHIPRERQAEARLEPLREHGAAESALQALQRLVEFRVVVHEVDHHHARLREREESAVVELGAGELRHVLLVLESVDDQRVELDHAQPRGAQPTVKELG